MPIENIHGWSLETSTELSTYYSERHIGPLKVIAVLNEAGIRFMLVGLHGIGGWMQEPRATQDVDVLVAAQHHKKALRALLAAFPQLEADEHEVVTRLRDRATKKVLIDVMKPNQPPYRQALKHSHTVSSGGQQYRIPSLEMALTMKFSAMISLTRADEDRHQDAHDFILMIKSNPDIDLDQLAELGDLVYNGGGQEVVEKVRQVRAGEKLDL